jgi:hypothetical protein
LSKPYLLPVLVALAGASALFSAQPGDEKSPWHADWATAQRIAAKENKPVFAVLVCKH